MEFKKNNSVNKKVKKEKATSLCVNHKQMQTYFSLEQRHKYLIQNGCSWHELHMNTLRQD